MALNHTALPQDERLPHYLRDEDPFASKLSWEADLVAGFYLTIIGILSTFGNGYVLYMSSRRKKKLRPAEIMTINLAVCDLGISVVGKPFTIISCFCHRWVFGWFGCRWYGWAGFFFGCGSLITMTAVSLDRYLKICYLSYGVWLKRKHAYICLAVIWAYASFWTTMPLVGLGDYAPEPFGTSCTLDWWLAQASGGGQVFILSILFFCLLLPTAVIVFSYAKIIAKVKSSSKEVAHFDSRIHSSHVLEVKLTKGLVRADSSPESLPRSVFSTAEPINCHVLSISHSRVSTVAMLICAGFLIAWIPYAVVSVWSAFGRPNSIPIQLSVVPTLLAKSAAMYNPIIYQVIDYRFACCQTGGLRATKKKSLEDFSDLNQILKRNSSTKSGQIGNKDTAEEHDRGTMQVIGEGEEGTMESTSNSLVPSFHSALKGFHLTQLLANTLSINTSNFRAVEKPFLAPRLLSLLLYWDAGEDGLTLADMHLKNVVVLSNRAVPDLLVPMLWMERVTVMTVTVARNKHLCSEAEKPRSCPSGLQKY
uniref:G protein-coupled receptor 136 n=2 Tax=Rattus norvegicus TaxID=10116 RepID=Q7TQN6_RAT|nr:G protein-coupled receptor 136 [Rattus norvegicus]|eukprot:NP_861437.1 opsin-5 [Rattus norvegicus]